MKYFIMARGPFKQERKKAMMNYEELPNELKLAVETYCIGEDAVDQCLDALIDLVPEKEAAITALVEAYGTWFHQLETARETLEARGMTQKDILRCGFQYRDSGKPYREGAQ